MTQKTIAAIFQHWRPRELEAMQRATSWLRAMQTEEWQHQRQQIANAQQPFKPMKGIR